MRKSHEVFRIRDGESIYRGTWEECRKFLYRSNGYFWLMIRPI